VKARRLTPGDDLAEAIALLRRFFAEEGFDTPAETIAARARELARLDTCGLFVAEAEGRTIGVATVSLEYGIEYGWGAEMGDLYVVPEYRGRGTARILVGAVESFLRSRGVAGYQVTVTPISGCRHDLAGYPRSLGFAGEGRTILRKRL
jgi:GNAT superfamily N-acetyltransferase